MTTPVRLRLSRAKGFSLQALSLATNGLPAVNVARPGPFGNLWRVGDPVYDGITSRKRAHGLTQQEAVDRHARSCAGDMGATINALRGKNLACWCRLCPAHAMTGLPFDQECADCEPCHGTTLGRVSNCPICEGIDA